MSLNNLACVKTFGGILRRGLRLRLALANDEHAKNAGGKRLCVERSQHHVKSVFVLVSHGHSTRLIRCNADEIVFQREAIVREEDTSIPELSAAPFYAAWVPQYKEKRVRPCPSRELSQKRMLRQPINVGE